MHETRSHVYTSRYQSYPQRILDVAEHFGSPVKFFTVTEDVAKPTESEVTIFLENGSQIVVKGKNP